MSASRTKIRRYSVYNDHSLQSWSLGDDYFHQDVWLWDSEFEVTDIAQWQCRLVIEIVGANILYIICSLLFFLSPSVQLLPVTRSACFRRHLDTNFLLSVSRWRLEVFGGVWPKWLSFNPLNSRRIVSWNSNHRWRRKLIRRGAFYSGNTRLTSSNGDHWGRRSLDSRRWGRGFLSADANTASTEFPPQEALLLSFLSLTSLQMNFFRNGL